MLRELKLLALNASSKLGITNRVGSSAWRRNRLLILSYHGISQRDEHLWNPGLFMPKDAFLKRMEYLRRRANVVPLGDGLRKLASNELPERSVAVTFDDGGCDFYRLAYPILKQFEIPSTLYLTTYYVDSNGPVFDPALRYILWSARGRRIRLDGVLPSEVCLDEGNETTIRWIEDFVIRLQLDTPEKERLLRRVADAVDFDYDDLRQNRLLHLMNAGEVREISNDVDIELHTHRHRVSRYQDKFSKELGDNRLRIEAMTGRRPLHFCYPGGNHLPEFRNWLVDAGVQSATTSCAGLCSRNSDRYLLPRLVETGTLTGVEFEAWINGVAAVFPRRNHPPTGGQFLEDWFVFNRPEAAAMITEEPQETGVPL